MALRIIVVSDETGVTAVSGIPEGYVVEERFYPHKDELHVYEGEENFHLDAMGDGFTSTLFGPDTEDSEVS